MCILISDENNDQLQGQYHFKTRNLISYYLVENEETQKISNAEGLISFIFIDTVLEGGISMSYILTLLYR